MSELKYRGKVTSYNSGDEVHSECTELLLEGETARKYERLAKKVQDAHRQVMLNLNNPDIKVSQLETTFWFK